MAIGRRIFWMITLGAFLGLTSGCASTSLRLVDEERARKGTGLHEEEGQKIKGYLLQDGFRAPFQGRVRLAESDSLVFWSEEDIGELGGQGSKGKIRVAGPVYPVEAVKALEIKETNAGKTTLLVLGVALVVGVVVAAVVAANHPVKIVADELNSQ